MGKRLDRFNKWADDHSPEILIVEGGITGALLGWVFSDPDIANWVGNGLGRLWKTVKENVHLTIGKPSQGHSGAIEMGSGAPRGKMGYYDYMDRCEQRRHEERMAQIKAGQAIEDEGGTVE